MFLLEQNLKIVYSKSANKKLVPNNHYLKIQSDNLEKIVKLKLIQCDRSSINKVLDMLFS